MDLANKSVAVTGGAGFIGSHLIDRIIEERPDDLVVIDNFSVGKERNLQLAKQEYPKLKIYRQDASNERQIEAILKNESIDVVFNLAIIPLPASLIKPKVTWDTNVRLTSAICELARRGYFKTLVHFSSSEAYGSAENVPMMENHPLKPTTPYGASKIASDHLVMSYIETFGIEASIVRPFNAYGPRQNEGTYAGVIPLTINRILQRKPPVIYGDGLQTRDYTYVTDLTDAAVRIYKEEETRGRVLNIASSQETTIKELVTKIAKLMNSEKPVVYDKARPGEVRRLSGSNLIARALIGYKPRIDLEQGLRLTIRWYSDLFDREKGRASRARGTQN
jgi:UDP-glucose 4-epimerase